MPRRIVPVFAILLAFLIVGTALVPGLREPVAARQASPTAGTPCPATSQEANEALVRCYLEEAYNGRNSAVIDELVADHFVRHSVGSPHLDLAHGNVDDVARVEAWLTAFPDLHIAIEKIIAADDTVVAWLV